jgi:hypothetical protein
MKTKQTIWLAMVVIMAVLAMTSGVRADLINPGFETDAVLDAEPNSIVTGWDNFNGAATASANLDPTRTGIGSLILPGNGGFGVPGASQIFAASPGQIWDFQGYGLTPTELPSDTTFGLLKIVWRDADNEELQAEIVNIGTGVGPDNPGIESTPLINSGSEINTWIFTQAQGVAPENTAFVEFLAIMVDQSEGTVYFDDLQATLIPLPPMSDIYIDIKPQSFPNPLNVKSKGVLPVAILGTEDFDVSEIDVSSILLEGCRR